MAFYNTSTAMSLILLSEGPIRLKNGLASVYLNRTPVANEDVATEVVSMPIAGALNSDGSKLYLGYNKPNDGAYKPTLIKKGAKQATGSITAGSATVTTTTAFFTSDMLASNSDGDGGLYQKVTITGAGVNGGDLEGEVISIVSSTEAVLDTAARATVSNQPVYWDHFTYSTISSDAVGPYADLSVSAGNSNLYNNTASGNFTTWTIARGYVGSTTTNLNYGNPNLNFKSVAVNFRGGSIDQTPISNVSGLPTASFGITPGVEIQQCATIPNPAGGTLSIYGQKTNPWWTNDRISDVFPESSGSPVIITTGTGTYGLNIASPGDIDEILLSMNFPEGLYGVKANEDAAKTDAGCVFQVYLLYKVSEAAEYTRKLILGPTYSDVANASGYFVHNQGALRSGGNFSGVAKARTDSATSLDFRINLQEFKPFDDFKIEIYKITPDKFKVGKWTYFQKSTLTAVQAIILDKLTYPYSSYLSVKMNSNEFQGTYPEIAAHCYGVETQVPDNYITREEATDGIAKYTRSGLADTGSYVPWTGTFRTAYCNNPIWNLRELLTNKRWGLGNWMDADSINDYSLYSLARYCDELVPDGNGGLEPRFTMGFYLTQSVEAYKVIKDFCTTMLALPYWVDGKLILEGDRKGEPVYAFSRDNIEGLFSYEGTGARVRTNQVAVTFNNRDDFYQQEVVLVDDIENIVSTNRINTEEVVAFGATSKSQAIRYGRWKLLTAKKQKEIVSFKTSDNAGFLKPGSIITIQDADKNRVRMSGLVTSATTTTVNLDSTVTLSASDVNELVVLVPGACTYLMQESATIGAVDYEYGDILPIYTEAEAQTLEDDSGNEVVVQFNPDIHVEKRTITTTGTVSSVTVSSAFSAAPNSEMIWAIISSQENVLVAGSPKEYKILAINEESKDKFTITAIEHYNSKYDQIDDEYVSDSDNVIPRYDGVPNIADFTAAVTYSLSTNIENAGLVESIINLSWEPPVTIESGIEIPYPYFDRYILTYQQDGEIIEKRLGKTATSFSLANLPNGNYEFSIRAISEQGPTSRPAKASVVVNTNSYIPSKARQGRVPSGGEFSTQLVLNGPSIIIPDTYTFEGESGKRLFSKSTAPLNPVEGTLWYDNDNEVLKEWVSGAWTVNGIGYNLTTDYTTRDEGTTVRVTLTTVGVADSTNVPYTITGIDSADIGGASLTGNFTITSNTDFIDFTFSNDNVTEGQEIFKLSLDNGVDNVRVRIEDTSVGGIGGSASITESADTASGSGSYTAPAGGITGSGSNTESADTVSSVGSYSAPAAGITGSGSNTESADTVSSAGTNVNAPTNLGTTEATSTFTFNKVSGVVENDLMICTLVNYSTTGTITVPSGWTPIGTQLTDATNSYIMQMAYKVAGASEPSTYTWSNSGGGAFPAALTTAYRGVNTSTPIANNDSSSSTGGSSTRDFPAITATNDKSVQLIVSVGGGGVLTLPHGDFTTVYSYLSGDYTVMLDRVVNAGSTGTTSISQTPTGEHLSKTLIINPA